MGNVKRRFEGESGAGFRSRSGLACGLGDRTYINGNRDEGRHLAPDWTPQGQTQWTETAGQQNPDQQRVRREKERADRSPRRPL